MKLRRSHVTSPADFLGSFFLSGLGCALRPRISVVKNNNNPELQRAMASSLRLQADALVFSSRHTSNITHFIAVNSRQQQSRTFSAAAQRWAYRTTNFRPSSVSQPSLKSRAKDVMRHQLPNDIGLLPGTFVRPLWRDMPSIFKDPRDRLRMEWTWMKSVFQGYARYVCLGLSCLFSLRRCMHVHERIREAKQSAKTCSID